MNRRAVILWLSMSLAACGSSGGGRGSESTGGEAPEASAPRGPDGCLGDDAGQAAACAARGCQWGMAPSCGGIERPDEDLVPRPCACTCERDLIDCMSAP